jgi:hypothetical protein
MISELRGWPSTTDDMVASGEPEVVVAADDAAARLFEKLEILSSAPSIPRRPAVPCDRRQAARRSSLAAAPRTVPSPRLLFGKHEVLHASRLSTGVMVETS